MQALHVCIAAACETLTVSAAQNSLIAVQTSELYFAMLIDELIKRKFD